MLDTKVWVDLKKDDSFYSEFKDLYKSNDLEVVFSHGNFLDMVRRDEQDELSHIIVELTDEYLGRFKSVDGNEYHHSDDPLILATVDNEWYQYCKNATQGLSDVETLKALFRDGDFDAEPASSVTTEFIEGLRDLERLEPEGRMEVPDNVPQSVALKKIGIFAEYAKLRSDGMARLYDSDVPLKRYVLGMSMIYLSEEPVRKTSPDSVKGQYLERQSCR